MSEQGALREAVLRSNDPADSLALCVVSRTRCGVRGDSTGEGTSDSQGDSGELLDQSGASLGSKQHPIALRR